MKSTNHQVRTQRRLTAARREALIWPVFVLLSLLAAVALASGQQTAAPRAVDAQSIELYQSLLDLQNPWTVMCVAAHPDDEDGRTLTLLRRKYGVRTVSLFSTYGEGGQNAVGPELYEELGYIRARETAEAASIQGSEPSFLGLKDFGFSKSADEAFRVWGHERALERMVYAIRKLRPDVIITNHDTVSGHGHHQATGRLVLEAFDAAADPARFPEQLKEWGIRAWQVQRLFVRVSYEGGAQSKPLEDEAQRAGAVVSIDANERDPVRGLTYAEQALLALHKHATQGPWPQTLPKGGVQIIRYRLAREAQTAAPLPRDAKTLLEGLRLPESFDLHLAPPTIDGRPLTDFVNERERVFKALAEASRGGKFNVITESENADAPRFLRMQLRLMRALALAAGVSATLTPRNGDVLIRGEDTRLSLLINNNGTAPLEVQEANFRLPDPSHTEVNVQTPVMIAPKSSVTVPISGNKLLGVLNVIAPREFSLSEMRLYSEPYNASLRALENNVGLSAPINSQVAFVSAVELTRVIPSPFVLTPATANQNVPFSLRVTNHLSRSFKGNVGAFIMRQACAQNLCPDYGLTTMPLELAAGETREVKLSVPLRTSYEPGRLGALPVNPLATVAPPFSLYFAIGTGDGIQWRDFHRGPDISAPIRVAYVDARVAPHLRVGYVRSYDYSLPSALASLGVESKELTVDDVRSGDLSNYQAVIIDNRGYQAHPELVAANSRLLDYARAGGTLIVFYHKSNEWNPDPRVSRPQLAPYPITLGNSRVTDEDAAVEFIKPEHPLMNYPNKITEMDFTGWIQERGLYYPQEWDSHYSALFAMNDPGEPSLRGGLLAAEYGRGHYIYTSMVWYRQLRAGLPGAYRMLANMISYGREKK